MNLVEQNIKCIHSLCEKHNVAQLYVFGSVLTDRFTDQSDVDFLVRFANVDSALYFDNYMDLKEGLENLLKRPVDLQEEQAIRNPLLKKAIEANRKLIYGRTDRKVAA